MNRDQWLTAVVKEHLKDVNIAVEVGVYRGSYSNSIVGKLQPAAFYGVDPYQLFEDYTNAPTDQAYKDQTRLNQLFTKTRELYKKQNNSTLLRTTGVEAAKQFDDLSIDFVYIDGDHTYEFVKGDIAAWWPKIKPGGILSGHDYIKEHHIRKIPFGVIQAVTEFAEKEKLEVKKTSDQYASWWVIKQ